MQLGSRISTVRNVRSTVGAAIRALFDNGEKGVWYDPSDFSTLFQDSAGTTPVTAVGQPVGLMLDKSKGLVLGSEQVVNGDFSVATGWSAGTGWAIANGKATKNGGATTNISRLDCSFVANRTYRVTIAITDFTSGNLRVELPGVQFHEFAPTGTGGTYTAHIKPTASGGALYIYDGSVAFAGSVDSVTIKELPGYHATQPTAASRPVLRGDPSSYGNELVTNGRFDVDTSGWTPVNGAALSVNNGELVLTTNGTSYPSGQFNVLCKVGKRYVLSAKARKGTCVQPATVGVAGILSKDVNSTSSTLVELEFTATNTSHTVFLQVGGSGANAAGETAIFDDVSIKEITAYSRYYLECDGVDDGMVTPSIDFTATDKMTVVAGARKNTDVLGMLLELSNETDVNNGSFHLLTSSGYATRSKGTTAADVNTSAIPAPDTKLLTAAFDITASTNALRLNAVAQPVITTSQGTGNYGNYPIYIGRRAGTSLPFNGRIYQLVVRGAASTDAQIQAAERFVASKTGITI